VQAGGNDYYLDPGAHNYPFGMLPWYATHTRGVRVENTGGTIVTTPLPPSSEATRVRRADLTLDEEDTLAGQLQVEFTGQWGALHREELRAEDESGRRKKLQDEISRDLPPGSTFEVKTITNWDILDAPLKVEGAVKIPALATSTGRRILLAATPFQRAEFQAFQPEKRMNMIYFHFPYEELDEVKVRPPAGYKVETVPPAQKIEPGRVSYSIATTQEGVVAQMKRRLVIGGILFPVQAYPALRTFFGNVKSNDEAQILFQRSEDEANKN